MTDIYWVVGPETNCGKTTVATALLRILNRHGIAAAGFKPFAVARLRENLDYLTHDLPGDRLYGSDAARLLEASALLDPDDFEIVAPNYLLVYQLLQDQLVMRTGSAKLGNQHFIRLARPEYLHRRKDIETFLATRTWQYATESSAENFHIQSAHLYNAGGVTEAFSYLLSMAPDAVVSEGAGGYLPVWPGCDRPDHIVVVDYYCLHLITDITESFDNLLDMTNWPALAAMIGDIRRSSRGYFRMNYPASQPADMAHTAETILMTLLQRARLLH